MNGVSLPRSPLVEAGIPRRCLAGGLPDTGRQPPPAHASNITAGGFSLRHGTPPRVAASSETEHTDRVRVATDGTPWRPATCWHAAERQRFCMVSLARSRLAGGWTRHLSALAAAGGEADARSSLVLGVGFHYIPGGECEGGVLA